MIIKNSLCISAMKQVLNAVRMNWIFGFHIIRPQNGLWINEDIEKYAEPVMYEIF